MTLGPAVFEDDHRCCALPKGHDGCCAWICSTCNGTGRCPECNGGAMSDGIGTHCEFCDESYACPDGCYEGMFSEGDRWRRVRPPRTFDAQLWGAYLLGLLLRAIPGDNYVTLRAIGYALTYGVAAIWLHGLYRWAREAGLKRTALTAVSLMPAFACWMIWFCGPGPWPVRVVLGIVVMVVLTAGWALVHGFAREYRRTRP